MSSVQDMIKCPQCGGYYITDYDCRTHEELAFCHRCGRREEYRLVSDENGKTVLDDEGKPQYSEVSHFGYGCLKLAGKKGVSSLYAISEPITAKMVEDIKKSFDDENIDVGECYLTKWDEKKQDVIAVFGSVPPLFGDELADKESDE